jgi:FkbM family methyltransferase
VSNSYGPWRRFLSFPYYNFALPVLRRLNFARPSAFDWAGYYLAKLRVPVTGIVDAGAFDGTISLHMADLFPNAKIFAFEPSPDTFAKLAVACQKQPRIKPFQLALSDQNGRAAFNINRAPGTNSLLTASQSDEMQAVLRDGGETLNQVTVETIKLDDFLIRHKTFQPTLLKTDTQGFDLNVLRGARQTLQASLRAVIAEVHFFSPAYEGDTSLLEPMDAYLSALGFSLVSIPSISPHPTSHRAFEADALWIRN